MHPYLAVTALVLAHPRIIGASPLDLTSSSYAVKESYDVPSQWTMIDEPAQHQTINLHIGLRQSRYNELENILLEVSDPSHVRYGRHLSDTEVLDLIRPSPTTLGFVEDWLVHHDIPKTSLDYSPGKDWINLSLPVQKVEKLLSTKYGVYQDLNGDTLVRTPQWSLPTHLHDHIDTIQPTNSFFRPGPRASTLKPVDSPGGVAPKEKHRIGSNKAVKQSNRSVPKTCNKDYILPDCLRALYGTLNYTVQVPEENSIGLTNYLGEISNRSDVKTFLEGLRSDAVVAADTFKVVSINGGSESTHSITKGKNKEGNLDAQTILGISHPVPLTTFNVGGKPPFEPDKATPTNTNEPYLDFLQCLLAHTDVPKVISTSYGDDEQTVPKSYAKRVCNTFAQLGARGISFLCSSGDSGVGRNGACFSNDGKNSSRFLPSFPASCPWVTTVGGTEGFDPEVAAYDAINDYASGGGFSDVFSQPWWQKTQVQSYIESLEGTYDGIYNKSGRAYPDIAAQGSRYVIIWNGQNTRVDGTSASCPTVAAIIALLNDARIAAGKPTLGFLNPWLYSQGFRALTDVLEGSSKGCDTDGFPATKGWDPVTGLGTPYFPELKSLALETKANTSLQSYYRGSTHQASR